MNVFDSLVSFIVMIGVSSVTYIHSAFDTLQTYITPPPTAYEAPTSPYIELGSSLRIENTPLRQTEKNFSSLFTRNARYQAAATRLSTYNENTASEEDTRTAEEKISDALVNIVCTQKTDTTVRTTTGTGFVINQKGVILTNAHVAQFLLLEDTNDFDVACVVRTGDPATSRYRADLLYISPLWVFHNARQLHETAPRGTGERDYALLYISGSTDMTPLPARFPFLELDVDILRPETRGIAIYLAGYPANALIESRGDSLLHPLSAESTINLLYTFNSQSADIFSIPETPVGEHGASGGPVLAKDTTKAIGMIVTKGDVEIEGPQSLRALSLAYINATMIEETGFDLTQNMAGDLAYRESLFREILTPTLQDLLRQEY